ncbi:hypothetical protein BaRGS_00010114 [Batillaria attramentaria]|uniref:EGF-like domain-containing protein n=1 Tax=Batillaria attramentaria TaxID=370345 RepID=A0ABD0LGT5_9CAEN
MNLHLVFLIGLLGCASPEEETEQSFLLPGKCTDAGTCGIHGTCTVGSNKCICGSDYTARTNECARRNVGLGSLKPKDAAYDETSGKCLPREINFSDVCGAINAECDGTIGEKKCKCLPGRFELGLHGLDHDCIVSAFPTKTCSVAGKTCSFNNGICSFTKSCICKPDYYAEYDRCVSRTFRPEEGLCPEKALCGGHGHCSPNNKTCVCFQDYFADGARCRRISFESDRSCSKADARVCAFGNGQCVQAPDKAPRCICNQGYFQEGDKCVTPYFTAPVACRAVGDKCDSGKGVCSDSEVCRCKGGYFAQRGRCVSGSFSSADCLSSTNKLCDEKRGKCIERGMCQCSKDSWVDNGTCVFPSFTQTDCEEGRDCSFGNGVCKGNATCMCKDRYLVYPVHAPNECRSSTTKSDTRGPLSSSSLASPFCLVTIVTVAGASTLFWY